MVDAAFAGFESKWTAALPEFGLALRFIDADARPARSALACIGCEIEHAASHIGEVEVAAHKLRWWLEEFEALGHGHPRHPLTRTLAQHADAGRVPMSRWRQAIAAALASLDPAPPSTLDALLEAHRDLHRPFAAAQGDLFGEGDADAVAEARALRRALRDALAVHDRAADARLVLPLDLLARHRLSRVDLVSASPARESALREFAGLLATRFDEAGQELPLLDAVAVHAERWRCRRLAAAREPLRRAPALFTTLPFPAVWQAWRTARRRRMAAAGLEPRP